jgi:hypothetical protein
MKYIQEVTDWGKHNVLNHVYYVNDDKNKMVGYIKNGSTNLFKFKKPMSFDGRGRKFVEVRTLKAESDKVYFGKVEDKPVNVIEIQGSSGKTYFLSKMGNRYTCTCPGFTFRHTCRHIPKT